MINIKVKGKAKANEPRVVITKHHKELWIPDTPLGRAIAERMEKEKWQRIKPNE